MVAPRSLRDVLKGFAGAYRDPTDIEHDPEAVADWVYRYHLEYDRILRVVSLVRCPRWPRTSDDRGSIITGITAVRAIPRTNHVATPSPF